MHHPFYCYPSGQRKINYCRARDRPLCHRHHVGSCVGSSALADADFLSAFLTSSQRSLRFDPCKRPLPYLWLGRQGSNLGMLESESSALPLGDAPIKEMDFLTKIAFAVKQKSTLRRVNIARSIHDDQNG